MDRNSTNFLDQMAPEWVAVPEIPRWVKVQCGVEMQIEWMAALIAILRENNPIVDYRIKDLDELAVNLKLAAFHLRWFDVGWLGRVPGSSGRLIILSWEAPHFDLASFTIWGPPERDGSHRKHPIEVRWDALSRWIALYVVPYKRRLAKAVLSSPPSATSEAPVQHPLAQAPGRDGDQRHADAVDAALFRTAEGKLDFDPGLFRAEYRTRVRRWEMADPKCDPPSPADDCKWAHTLFHRVARQHLRTARQDLAPESWKTTGKRTGVKWHE